MKLLVMSDTHGLEQEIVDVVNCHKDEISVFYHCGDSELDPDAKELAGFRVVKGNCDFTKGFPNDLFDVHEGYPLYMTHGHLYKVKFSPLGLKYRAEEVGAKLILFGHTHVAEAVQEGECLFINPGSLRLPRGHSEGTYAIIELKPNQQIEVAFYNRQHKRVDQKSFQLA